VSNSDSVHASGRRSRAFHSTSTRHRPSPPSLLLRLAVPRATAAQLHPPSCCRGCHPRAFTGKKGGGAGWNHENVAPPPL
jgi:hypothetical protein